MKNRPIPTDRLSAGKSSSGLRGLFNQFFKRGDDQETPKKALVVKVWDAQRDSYRNVDLRDHNDPLWPTAKELYLFSKSAPNRDAA